MAREKGKKETDSAVVPVVKSASWLRRTALAIALLGLFRVFLVWPAHSLSWKVLPPDVAFSWLWTDLAMCLWIAGSGFLLGFLAEAASRGEEWAGPFARGVCNLLLVIALSGAALGWTNPVAWLVLILAAASRIFAAS
jgi:hypothetical protein